MNRKALMTRVCAAGLIIFSALAALGVPVDTPFEIVKTEKFEGVIIPREKAADFMKAFSGKDERETWTPGRNDVLRLERRIEAYLKMSAKQSPELWSKLASYKRQYLGVVRNQRRVIFINFFCDAFNTDWKTVPVVVEDGGDCFFNVLYDPQSATFSELRINGEA